MENFLAQFMPPNASAHGPRLDFLNSLVHWLMLILFLLWGAYFVFVLFRFRAKRNPKASYEGMKSHWSTYSEFAVMAVEVILLVGFSIPAWSHWNEIPAKASNPLEIRVVAEQFAWNIHYPGPDGVFGHTYPSMISATNPLGLDPHDPNGKDDVFTLNQLHLEVNRPVLIHLTSKDVIHSFNLPVMRVKQDAIPGIEVPIHFTPVKQHFGEMTWEIACAQLCGLGHYRMRGMLSVDTKQQFQKFLKASASTNQTADNTSAPTGTVPAVTPGTVSANVKPQPPTPG